MSRAGQPSLRVDHDDLTCIPCTHDVYNGAHICAEHLLGYGVTHLNEEIGDLVSGEVMASHEGRDVWPESHPSKDKVQIGRVRTYHKSRSAVIYELLKARSVILRVQSELKKRPSHKVCQDPVDEPVGSHILFF